jgi:serine/threonine protein kinase
MLVGDPNKRATLGDIMEHPWFRKGLSPEVLSFNDPLVEKSRSEPVTPEIEQEIARIVEEASEMSGRMNHMDDVDAVIDNDGNSTEDMKAILEQI